jgi:hypothetical protein
MTDMTPDEMALMMRHAGYWAGLLQQGKVIVFGPVADPNGGYGVGVVNVETPEELAELQAQDPAILAGVGFSSQAFPMPRAVYAGA